MLGKSLSHYRVLEKLGEGGMGVIYRALDTRLGRTVALKLLRPDVLGDPDHKARFAREAHAASALNHPNIVTIYDVDCVDGLDFIAMEHLDGEALDRRLARDVLPVAETVRIARGIAEALAAAHRAGIVHRDIKPANVMLTRSGLVKVLDFGLAKMAGPLPLPSSASTKSISLQTGEGVVVGTVAYMSPEQAQGRAVDERSDVFSFGIVLFELLCGQRPFQGASVATVLSAILRDPPPPPRRLRPEVPRHLERVLLRCLEKDPAQRYPSAEDLARDLAFCEAALAGRSSALGLVRRHKRAAAVAALGLAAAGAVSAGAAVHASHVRWAREVALPEAVRLAEAGDYARSYHTARAAERYLPGDPGVRAATDRVTVPLKVETDPPGAEVFYRGYLTDDSAWERLGTSPLTARVPYGLPRWKVVKEGYETVEGATLSPRFVLDPTGTRPAGMVRVVGGAVAPRYQMPQGQVGNFWLDRHEATNREYKAFVDAGGYARRELWPPFEGEGRAVPWEEGMARLRDATGRPGPAGWDLGAYPEGRDDFPVGGVSWYEAAAYCAWQGKALPTVYHWYRANSLGQFSTILEVSNFGSAGPVKVGSRPGLGAFGTYDTAGNVKEWCWNAAGERRYILGGAWGETSYMFAAPEVRSPAERLPTHGIRCARYIDPPSAALLGPVNPERKNQPAPPVSDEVFAAVRSVYAYAPGELAARVESVDDASPYWRKEKVSYAAGYGDERVLAYLFLPRNAAPPYQAVVWFPGGDARLFRSSETLASPFFFDFIPRAGRVLVYPVYKGFYERSLERLPASALSEDPQVLREMLQYWVKDIGRTLDYLQTRPDIDGQKLAYYGLSLGATRGPLFTAVETRFKASVLLAGGYQGGRLPPDINTSTFAPHVRVPTLMINGRDDFLIPADTQQKTLFDLLGPAPPDKRHALIEGGHIPSRTAAIKETLDWLDRYLGPVRTK